MLLPHIIHSVTIGTGGRLYNPMAYLVVVKLIHSLCSEIQECLFLAY